MSERDPIEQIADLMEKKNLPFSFWEHEIYEARQQQAHDTYHEIIEEDFAAQMEFLLEEGEEIEDLARRVEEAVERQP